MNQTRVIIGLGIIILAMIAIRMEVLLWTFQVGGINLKIYPAYGLAVIGGLMVVKEILRDKDNLYLFKFHR
jgi:hypothetical protein